MPTKKITKILNIENYIKWREGLTSQVPVVNKKMGKVTMKPKKLETPRAWDALKWPELVFKETKIHHKIRATLPSPHRLSDILARYLDFAITSSLEFVKDIFEYHNVSADADAGLNCCLRIMMDVYPNIQVTSEKSNKTEESIDTMNCWLEKGDKSKAMEDVENRVHLTRCTMYEEIARLKIIIAELVGIWEYGHKGSPGQWRSHFKRT